MDRTQQRCLFGSTAAHGGLIALILLVSGLAAHKVLQPDVPFMEMIPTDLKLTMGHEIGGGTPNPVPPAPKESAPPASKVVNPEPVLALPPTKIEPKVEPKVAEKTKPVDPPKPAERKIEVNREVRTLAKAQDVDLAKKAEKTALVPPTKIQVSNQTRTRTDADKKVEREAKEAKAAAEAEAAAETKAQQRRFAAAQKLASRISGAVTGVSENVGSSTKIDMPAGSGGAAYGPYLSWLETFLYERWRRPSTSSQQKLWVDLEVVIARDGTVLSATITHSSGLRSLDASTEEVFRQNRKLRPLPDDYHEPRLVVPVKFVLEAPGSP